MANVDLEDSFLEKVEREYGDYAKRRLLTWQKIMREEEGLPVDEKLKAVNDFFNLLAYRSDIRQWGKEDYWATPIEFIVSGSGDCEDYSIAKYFTLVQLGVEADKLHIMYVKALNYNQAHMVLTHYDTPSSVPLVLDNLDGEIKPANERADLIPVYSFNGESVWSEGKGKQKKIGKSQDLKKWADLERRMKKRFIGKFRN